MVIIGILISLITVAVIAAQARATVAKVGVDIAGLEQALNSYRDKFGEYPPDCEYLLNSPPSAVQSAIQAAFCSISPGPFRVRMLNGGNTWSNLQSTLRNQFGFDIAYLDPSTSLTFFLGGVPEIIGGQFTGQLIGFSANPSNPFERNSVGPFSNAQAAMQAGSRIPPFLDFETSRLVRTVRKFFRYVPPYGPAPQVPPYVYFRAPYYFIPTGATRT